MIRIKSLLTLYCFLLISCQSIETHESLDKGTKDRLKKLGILADNERIIQYYSNLEKDKAGNFFTDKRIAHYWLDDSDNSKTEISFSYYQDIVSIDTNFNVQDFDLPFMTIKKKDSSSFKVYIDGTKEEKKIFFTSAIERWKMAKVK